MSQQDRSSSKFAGFLLLKACSIVCFLPIVVSAQTCEVSDNGSGTVTLPPAGCDYLSPGEVHMIIDGLPVGTTIQLAAIHTDFICHPPCCGVAGECPPCPPAPQEFCNFLGGSLGGEAEQFDSVLRLTLTSTGLQGFNRTISVPASCEVHTAPRAPGDPIQTFANDMFSLQGSVAGDPDFDVLTITAGTQFGMPSSGETKLTRLANGAFQVDSFFDISYAISFTGAPGSVLAGHSGTTTGSVRMGTLQPAPRCEDFTCGNHNEKLLICHQPSQNAAKANTLCLAADAAADHLRHHEQDHCGPCASVKSTSSVEHDRSSSTPSKKR